MIDKFLKKYVGVLVMTAVVMAVIILSGTPYLPAEYDWVRKVIGYSAFVISGILTIVMVIIFRLDAKREREENDSNSTTV